MFYRGIILCLLIATSAFAAPPKKLLLIGHPPDGHPKSTHEYMDGLKILSDSLSKVEDLEITTVKAEGKWENGPELIERSDAIVLFVSEGAKWISGDEKRLKSFQNLANRGGGLTVLHWGMGTKEAQPIATFCDLFGACHGGPDRKYKELETDLRPVEKHPIAYGISTFKVKEEFYYKLKTISKSDQLQPVLEAKIDNQWQMVAWSWERPDRGRSFGFSGLHFHENWRFKEYRRLVCQGVLWTAKLSIAQDGLRLED